MTALHCNCHSVFWCFPAAAGRRRSSQALLCPAGRGSEEGMSSASQVPVKSQPLKSLHMLVKVCLLQPLLVCCKLPRRRKCLPSPWKDAVSCRGTEVCRSGCKAGWKGQSVVFWGVPFGKVKGDGQEMLSAGLFSERCGSGHSSSESKCQCR